MAKRLAHSRATLFASACAVVVVLAERGGFAQRIPADDRTPKLIVLLVVDQFRANYIDMYHQQWSHGLKRLLTDGAWFRQAYYPFFNTVTCPGHVSVGTGAVPAVHGVVLNEWWEHSRGRRVTCTEDERHTPISYGRTVSSVGESAWRVQLPFLADELRAQRSPPGRTIAFSLKSRSAIPLSGRRPDAVAWFDDSGSWATSTAFASGPIPAVADFVRRNPVEADFGRTWDLALHRVYTSRRDDTLRVTHGDVVAVRDGYHPFVTAYGYDAYYLNVLAGDRRSMAASDDARYAQWRCEWPAPDPRLPLVQRPSTVSWRTS